MRISVIPCILIREDMSDNEYIRECAVIGFDNRFVKMEFKVFEAHGVKIPFLEHTQCTTKPVSVNGVHLDPEVLKPKYLGRRKTNLNKGNFKVSLPKECNLPRNVEVYTFWRAVILKPI